MVWRPLRLGLAGRGMAAAPLRREAGWRSRSAPAGLRLAASAPRDRHPAPPPLHPPDFPDFYPPVRQTENLSAKLKIAILRSAKLNISYEDTSLTFRLRGGSLKVFACRTFLSDPMATKNAGSREEKYIFHREKKIIEKIYFFLVEFLVRNFFLGLFHDFPSVNRHRFTEGKS